MALELNTNEALLGSLGNIPVRAPLPDDALGLMDFTTGLHLTQAAVAGGRAANIVLNRSTSIMSSGWFYGRDGIEAAAPNFWDRMEYGPDGECLGLLVEPDTTQRISRAQRTDLSAGILTGATLATVAPPLPEPAAQWWQLTPAGGGEASLQLGTGSVTQTRLLVSFEVRSAGGRYAQIGTKAGDANAWANVDLFTGEITSKGADVEAAAVARPGGGWHVYAITRKNLSSLSDLQPYVASVAAADTGKLGAAGGAIQIRAPIVKVRSGEGLVPGSPYAHASADTRNADSLQPLTSLLSGAATDFTIVFRCLSGWAPTKRQAALFTFVGGAAPFELRYTLENQLRLTRALEGEVLAELAVPYMPDQTYRVGVSRSGNRLAVCVNDVTGEASSADLSNVTGWRLLRGNDTARGWDGHLQKVVLWPGGRSAAELASLVRRWV